MYSTLLKKKSGRRKNVQSLRFLGTFYRKKNDVTWQKYSHFSNEKFYNVKDVMFITQSNNNSLVSLWIKQGMCLREQQSIITIEECKDRAEIKNSRNYIFTMLLHPKSSHIKECQEFNTVKRLVPNKTQKEKSVGIYSV